MDPLPALPLAPGRTEPPCITEGCSACCHDTEMLLSTDDVQRIANAVAADPDLRAQEDTLGPWYFEADDGFLQLYTRPGTAAGGQGAPCWFLGDDGLCRIWESRPEGCRIYPAVWDDGIAFDVDCPHTDGFSLQGAQAGKLAKRLELERTTRDASKAP